MLICSCLYCCQRYLSWRPIILSVILIWRYERAIKALSAKKKRKLSNPQDLAPSKIPKSKKRKNVVVRAISFVFFIQYHSIIKVKNYYRIFKKNIYDSNALFFASSYFLKV